MKKTLAFLIILFILTPIFGGIKLSVPAESAEGRVSIVELFTATWCSFCPAAEKVVSDAFDSANGKFVLVEYHLGDPFATKSTTNRGYFYGITGTPTAIVNGKYKFIGTRRIKDIGLPRALDDAGKAPLVQFTKLDAFIANGSVNVEAYVKGDAKSPVNLFFLLVEDNVTYKGKNYRFVVRDMSEFKESGQAFSEEASFKISNNYNEKELYIVSFVQDQKTEEIYQAKEIKVSNGFSAPTLTMPNKPIDNFPYTLTFSKIDSAEKYEVQFATDKLFYTIVKDEVVSMPQYLIKKSEFISGTYFVRVRALKGKIVSPWSDSITVVIKVLKKIVMKVGSPFMEVDGKKEEIDPGRGTKPVIIPKWGRTVVPIRAIVEAFGGDVEWDDISKTVTITFEKRELPPEPPVHTIYIVMQIDNPQATVNGIKKWIDPKNHNVAPVIINNRTMVPLRFVAETLGCTVDWDPVGRTITITLEE